MIVGFIVSWGSDWDYEIYEYEGDIEALLEDLGDVYQLHKFIKEHCDRSEEPLVKADYLLDIYDPRVF